MIEENLEIPLQSLFLDIFSPCPVKLTNIKWTTLGFLDKNNIPNGLQIIVQIFPFCKIFLLGIHCALLFRYRDKTCSNAF